MLWTMASWGLSPATPTRSPTWGEGPRESLAEGGNSAFWVYKGEQGNDPGPFNGVGEIALLLGGETRETTRQDLAALSDELLEQIDILVVDRIPRLDGGEAFFEEGTGHGERIRTSEGLEHRNHKEDGTRAEAYLISL